MSERNQGESRRMEARGRVFWGGEIAFSEFFEPFACVVRDFSAAGARIELPGKEKLPEHVQISIPTRRMKIIARVAWRNGRQAGLAFETFLSTTSRDCAISPRVPAAGLRGL